jgi:hypothetical protein
MCSCLYIFQCKFFAGEYIIFVTAHQEWEALILKKLVHYFLFYFFNFSTLVFKAWLPIASASQHGMATYCFI